MHCENGIPFRLQGGYDEDYLADLRRDSIREVSETNGSIRMEERFK